MRATIEYKKTKSASQIWSGIVGTWTLNKICKVEYGMEENYATLYIEPVGFGTAVCMDLHGWEIIDNLTLNLQCDVDFKFELSEDDCSRFDFVSPEISAQING